MQDPDDVAPSRATLPPPEWTAPATLARVSLSTAPQPLARRKGGRAEEGTLRAKLAEARATGDAEAAWGAAITLARWLSSRDRDLDEAARLVTEALSWRDDPELRRELSSWLESLGEPGKAALALEGLLEKPEIPPDDATFLRVRIGVLHARAGAAARAADAFLDATERDPADALAAELRGALAAWATGAVTAREGAASYLEAARRRAAAGDEDAALEDTRRAFATDPSSEEAAEALATAIAARGRAAAADEVWRTHAAALADPAARRGVHARRRGDAGDLEALSESSLRRGPRDDAFRRALGAALDERLDEELSGPGADAFDLLLLRIGLLDLVALRLEARAATEDTPAARAKRWDEVARLSAGALADPDRAAAAQVAALAADPTSEAAMASLSAQLGEAARRLTVTGGDARLEPVRRLAAILRDVPDEGRRRAILLSSIRDAVPHEVRWAAAEASLSSPAAVRGASPAALEELAAKAVPSIKAVLLAVAAERWLAANDPARARAAAEHACQAEPQSPRAVATLASVVMGERDRNAAAALERALNLVGARASWCAALADALEELGENGYAVAWTQRQVALRPGDASAIDTLLARIVRARDPARLGDALAWVLSQPQPFGAVATRFAEALHALVDLDRDRAVVLARRALDVFGPKHPALRDAMLSVADDAGDDAFAAAILERWVASSDEGKKGEVFVRLADRRNRLGDRDAEARVVARSVREVGSFPLFHARVARLLGEGVSHDGELSLASARADLLARGDDDRAAAGALRDLGAAMWDLSGDRRGAVDAWLRAAKRAPARGFAALAVDLAGFEGHLAAQTTLERLAEEELAKDPATAGSLGAEAARLALQQGDPSRAFELAETALLRNPAYADALEIAERSAAAAAREEDLSAMYFAVAAKALGRFGRRAAHYRGARYFEQRGVAPLALRHAAQAFLAVPTEGATFVLLARTAQRAGDPAQAMETVEHIADRAKSGRAKAAWLLRAATIAGGHEEGARRRFDLLLKAVVLARDLGTLSLLGDAATELVRLVPEEEALVEMRVSRAKKVILEKLDGPEGARLALAFAETGLELFDDAEGALLAIERALGVDADLDEYAAMAARASRLSAAPGAAAFLERVVSAAEKPYANVGVPALRLFTRLASHLQATTLHARAAVLAAERDPEDDALVLEADATIRASGDATLLERFTRKVTPARRIAAMRAWSKERALGGAWGEAIASLERAAELTVDPTEKDAIERELVAAYEAAGRPSEIEQRAAREATSVEATPAMRAERWTEIAERRENRHDLAGAIRALQEAAKLDPGPVQRWSALERVAELMGDDEVRVGALRELALRVKADGRVPVYKRLARAHERRRDLAAAEEVWRLVAKLDEGDEESDQAIEAVIVAGGRWAELSDHLAARAERLAGLSGRRETLRAVRLRRAAILEQRLGRLEDACDELSALLAEWPDNSSALRYLADLYDRAGEPGKAAPLWRRAAAIEREPNSQDELELRAARASAGAGDAPSALRHVRAVLVRNPGKHDALTLHVELARMAGDATELGEALEALATAEASDAAARSDMLVEAAQVAARTGDADLALSRAQKAAQIAPDRAASQLLARGLEYRLRGAGEPPSARRTIEDLKRIRGPLAPEDTALRAFLLAEALDVVQGGGAGMRELSQLPSELSGSALVAVGIAERLAAQGNHAGALPHFALALRGSLLGLRKPAVVALAAAESAVRCMQVEEAAHLLQFAAGDPDTRLPALARGAHLALIQGWLDRAESALVQLASTPGGEESARTLLDLVRLLFASTEPAQKPRAEQILRELLGALPPAGELRARLLKEIEASRRDTPMPASPPPPSPRDERAPSPGEPRAVAVIAEKPSSRPATDDSPQVAALEAEVLHAAPGAARSLLRRRLARALFEQGEASRAEAALWGALADGSVQAGDELAHLFAPSAERTGDVVRVRRAQVDLAPGDASLLDALRAAAVADDDKIYARAVEHVQRAFDPGAGPLPPPPLAAQAERPGTMSLLSRPSQSPHGEALALVYEGAAAVFNRDAKSYGIHGVERVVPGSSSPLARVYETAIRVLESPRVPLFVTKPTGALAASVALIAPPAVILTGDVREETPELRFVLGRGMSAALRTNVLVLGVSRAEAVALRKALLSAFGPPDIRTSLDQASGKLAESFWQLLPPRTQRRLSELLATGELPDYEALAAASHQSGRRVGLFLAGDFATAARALAAELGFDADSLSGPGALAARCREVPELADLLRLAVSPEYADARWHPVAPASTRGTVSSTRFSIV